MEEVCSMKKTGVQNPIDQDPKARSKVKEDYEDYDVSYVRCDKGRNGVFGLTRGRHKLLL